MKTQIVASSFIRRRTDGKYLILRRSDTDKSRKGEWDLAGGVVDLGETIKEGALREVKEEAGLQRIESVKLLFSASGVAFSEAEQAEKNYVFLYYVMIVAGDEDVVLSFEHDNYRWVDKKELATLLTHRAQAAAYDHIFSHALDE